MFGFYKQTARAVTFYEFLIYQLGESFQNLILSLITLRLIPTMPSLSQCFHTTRE